MKKILSLFFCLGMMSVVFAGFKMESSSSLNIDNGSGGVTTVTTPAVPGKSDKLVIPSWLVGSFGNEMGTFSFTEDNVTFMGDMEEVGLAPFFQGSLDLAKSLASGETACKERRLYHRVELSLYTTSGEISFLFVKKGKDVMVSKSAHRYYKEEGAAGKKMFKSSEKGTVGLFTSIQ